jgi:serine carboxypeptidase 1
MGSHFALQLWKDIQAGTIQANLQGFAMGNSWISPIDSTMTWGPLLYSMSLVDDQGYEAIQNAAGLCETAVNEERWNDATDLWGATESVVLVRTHYVDFYNILKFVLPGATGLKTHRLRNKYNVFLPAERATDPLDVLMNGEIKDKLGIIPENVTWGGQYDAVFTAQEGDFMKPVIATVDEVLMTTNLQVVVYEGQLDLICDTLGVMQWVQKLTWSNLANYNNATRQWFVNQDTRQTEMFVKAHNQFKFYWVLDAGHSVPKDNGNTAYRMMERILGNTDV